VSVSAFLCTVMQSIALQQGRTAETSCVLVGSFALNHNGLIPRKPNLNVDVIS
jgi:hypothetical protein